jgi:hypothetical protein
MFLGADNDVGGSAVARFNSLSVPIGGAMSLSMQNQSRSTLSRTLGPELFGMSELIAGICSGKPTSPIGLAVLCDAGSGVSSPPPSPPSPPPPSPPPPSPPPPRPPPPSPSPTPTPYYSPPYYYPSGSSSDDSPIGLIVGVVVGVLVLLGGIAAAVVWHKRKSKSDSEPKDFSSAVIGYPQATDPASIELQVVPTAQPVLSPAPPSIPVRASFEPLQSRFTSCAKDWSPFNSAV